jgi:hypothetical protein
MEEHSHTSAVPVVPKMPDNSDLSQPLLHTPTKAEPAQRPLKRLQQLFAAEVLTELVADQSVLQVGERMQTVAVAQCQSDQILAVAN